MAPSNDDDWLDVYDDFLEVDADADSPGIEKDVEPLNSGTVEDVHESSSSNADDSFCVVDDGVLDDIPVDKVECVESEPSATAETMDKAIGDTLVGIMDKAIDATFVEKVDKAVDTTQRVESVEETDTKTNTDTSSPVKVIPATYPTTAVDVKEKASASLPKNKNTTTAEQKKNVPPHYKKCLELEEAMFRATENLAQSLNKAFIDFVGDTPPPYHGKFVKPKLAI